MSDLTSDDIAGAVGSALDDAPEAPPSETDSSPVTPVPEPVVPPTSAIATSAPTGTVPATVPSVPGPIPFDRHTSIIDNTRRKSREEARAEYLKELGAESEADIRNGLGIFAMLKKSPEATIAYLQSQLQKAAEPPPDKWAAITPGLASEDGRAVYTADEIRTQIVPLLKEEIRQSLIDEWKPIMVPLAEREAQARATAMTTPALAEAAKWPHFAALKADMGQFIAQLPDPVDIDSALDRAYTFAYRKNFGSLGAAPAQPASSPASGSAVAAAKRAATTTAPGAPHATQPSGRNYGKAVTTADVEMVWNALEGR